MALLDTRDVTEEERAAIADEPRSGVWVERHELLSAEQNNGKPVVSCIGDGRPLDQTQTDSAIAAALFRNSARDESNDVLGIVVASLTGCAKVDGKAYATDQRGGIHSDPLVRLLAFRAWGDRDRAWRKRDTARSLMDLNSNRGLDRIHVLYGWDGLSISFPEFVAQRGSRQARVVIADLDIDRSAYNAGEEYRERWLDVLDELDAKLEAGGDPLPSGPLTFDLTAGL